MEPLLQTADESTDAVISEKNLSEIVKKKTENSVLIDECYKNLRLLSEKVVVYEPPHTDDELEMIDEDTYVKLLNDIESKSETILTGGYTIEKQIIMYKNILIRMKKCEHFVKNFKMSVVTCEDE